MPKTYSLLKVEDGESTYKPQLDNDVDVHKKQVLEKLVVKNTSTSENNILINIKKNIQLLIPIYMLGILMMIILLKNLNLRMMGLRYGTLNRDLKPVKEF